MLPTIERAYLRKNSVEEALGIRPNIGDFDKWDIKGGNARSYSKSFKEVLEGRSLRSLVVERKREAGQVLVLDLLGYGTVLRDLKLDGGLAVALCDPRPERQKKDDQKDDIDILVGNIMQRSTWKGMDQWLHLQGGEESKFDLILCRGWGGMEQLGDSKSAAFILLQRAWDLLSPNGGRLLTQLPHGMMFSSYNLFLEEETNAWIDLANQIPGIQARYAFPPRNNEPRHVRASLSLIRGPEAPEKLPLL